MDIRTVLSMERVESLKALSPYEWCNILSTRFFKVTELDLLVCGHLGLQMVT